MSQTAVLDVASLGFHLFETPSDELPLDRHCILRPNPVWKKSEYRKLASELAEKSKVIAPPRTREEA
jgi:hypothetical protein